MRCRRKAGLTIGLIVGLAWLAPPLAAERPNELYTVQNKTATSSAVASGTVLWTPATGYRIALMGCSVSSGGAQKTTLQINSVTVLAPIYTAADSNYVTQNDFPIAMGAADNTLTYTTTSSTTTTINCWGYEWQG